MGKTGTLIEQKPKQYKKKLRSAGHAGGLVKADTIVRFTNGIKRYILTAIDLETEFAFAYVYSSHNSKHAADFMKTFKAVAPISLTHVQTDNGSEFADHFESFCDDSGIVHFHAYPKSPKMNAEIERFNRTLSEAFIARNRHLLAYNLPAFNKALMDWLLWYNTRRPHWSIGLLSPLRYIVNKLPAEKSHMCWTSTGPDYSRQSVYNYSSSIYISRRGGNMRNSHLSLVAPRHIQSGDESELELTDREKRQNWERFVKTNLKGRGIRFSRRDVEEYIEATIHEVKPVFGGDVTIEVRDAKIIEEGGVNGQRKNLPLKIKWLADFQHPPQFREDSILLPSGTPYFALTRGRNITYSIGTIWKYSIGLIRL